MGPGRVIAAVAAGSLFVAAAFLVVDRGGLLAWLGVVLGALLAAKILLRPAPRDAVLALAIVGGWIAAWGLAWAYVVSTWESGEVVELVIDGEHTARVWVLDEADGPVMYYDAPPEAALRLLDGAPLSMTRDGRARTACAAAKRVDALPEARVQALLERMEAKYAGLDAGAVVFYAVLGGKRDRVGLLIGLAPCGA